MNFFLKFRGCSYELYIGSSFRFYKTITLHFHTLAHYILQHTVLTFIKLSFVSTNLELVL